MHIQFFGHSVTNTSKDFQIKTFVDILLEKYQATCYDYPRGKATCSEERILYDLKKIKKIDIAIIFHSEEDYYLTLGDNRDHNFMTEEELNMKFSEGMQLFQIERLLDRPADIAGYEDLEFKLAKELFKNHQKYFLSRDIVRNRFFGALIQIDQYCTAKKIPVIHCPVSKKSIPTWFNFSSGFVDYEISPMGNKHSLDFTHNPYYAGYHRSDNAITKEGNIIIADKLSFYIDRLIDNSEL